MIQRIAQKLELEPSQLRNAVALGAILFCITSSYTLVKTARDSLYLSQLPAALLPYVFMGVGVLTLLVSQAFARLTQRLSVWKTLAGAALTIAIALAGFAYLFRLDAPWVPVVFYLWVNVYGLILVSAFWAFTTSVSDSREAKRTFGIIGGGGIFGGLVGGLVAIGLSGRTDLVVMTFVGAALMVPVAPMVRAGILLGHVSPDEESKDESSRRPDRPSRPRVSVDKPASKDAQTPIWRIPYLRWLGVATLCSVVVTGLLDYQLKVEIQNRYRSEAALAAFFGLFYTVLNVVALVFQLLVTRWSLVRLGAGNSAVILPAGLGLGAIATLLTPGFTSILITRLWDQVTRLSLNRSAVELFFFPIEPALRRRAKAVMEATLERMGDAFAGLLILGADYAVRESTASLALMVVVLVAVWLAALTQVRRGYKRQVGHNLRRMNLQPEQDTVSLREASLLVEMTSLLNSPYERVVLYGIEMLEESAPWRLRGKLPELLAHPSPRVRARSLALVASRPTEESRKQVAKLLNDPDPVVRVEAMRAHCALGQGRPTTALDEFLESEDVKIRGTALQCLVQYAPESDESRVRAILERRLRDGTPEERAEAAQALGLRPTPNPFHDLLAPLLQDPELEVRRAALRAAGLAQGNDHLPALTQALAHRETENAAREGLVALGDRVVGTLGDYLSDPSVPIEVRRVIPKVLAEIPTEESMNALFRWRERGDVVLAYRILKAANRIRVLNSALEFPLDLVNEDIDYDVQGCLRGLVHYRANPIGTPGSTERFLCLVLNECMDQSLNRVFRRLALIYPPRTMWAAYRGVLSEDPRRRSDALDYMEGVLSAEHRERIMLLIDDSGDEERLREAESRYGLSYKSSAESLRALLTGDDPWLRTCALYLVGVLRERSFLPGIQANLDSKDARAREAAGWALAAIGAA